MFWSPEQNGVHFITRLLTNQNNCYESYVKIAPQNQENLAEKVVVTVTTTFKSGSDTSLPDEYKVTPMGDIYSEKIGICEWPGLDQ